MTRHTDVLILIFVSTVIIANGCLAATDGRANFLFIVVDDQSPFDLKVYNPASSLETPNIDRLAREGMVFDCLDGRVRRTQLFNLADNPLECLQGHHAPEVVALTGHQPATIQVNVADHPRYEDKRRQLEALLLAEMRRLHDPFRLWDQPQEDPN